jgi:hypothetical protein
MVKLFRFPLSLGFKAIERKSAELISQGWLFMSCAHVATSDGPGAFVIWAMLDPSLATKADESSERIIETPESPSATDILSEPEIVSAGNGANGHDSEATAADSPALD